MRSGFHKTPKPRGERLIKQREKGLSAKQIEALQLAADGETSITIAILWGYRNVTSNSQCGPVHVRWVWKRCAAKLGADITTQAVAMALRKGLIT